MNFRNPVPSKNYQPHIDGLRALAIIPVFLYHLNASYCSGGFGGVDVFFVISGFLISLGLFKNFERGTFSLLDFYDKRIRRIIPIYSVTIISVLIASIFILDPYTFENLVRIARYGTFFLANVKLNIMQDYFAQGLTPNALTNLWSLSVEEQFYIFLPILLILSYKFAKKYVLQILCLVFAASFGLVLYHFFTGNLEQQAFYLLPFRIYELLMGSFLAYFTLNRKEKSSYKGSFIGKFLALFALVGLIATYYILDENYLFPSLWAFVLCAFSVMLIKYGNLGFTGRILESKPLVFIGRISYSVYLIHFPLIILFKYANFEILTISDEILITLITFGLSTLTWAFIELPIRLSTTWTSTKSFILLGASVLVIISFVQISHKTNCFRKYIPISPYTDIQNVQTRETFVATSKNPSKRFPSFANLHVLKFSENKDDSNILIFGDSHMTTMASILDREFYKRNIPCDFIYERIGIEEYPTENSKFLSSIFAYLDANPNIKNVLIIHRWTYRDIQKDLGGLLRKRFKKDEEKFKKELSESFIAFIKELKGKGVNIFVASTVPEPLFDVGAYGYRVNRFKGLNVLNYPMISKEQYEQEHTYTNSMFKALEDEKLAKIIRMEVPLLDKSGKFYRFEGDNGELFYYDDDHLSLEGASIVVPHILDDLVKRIEKQNK